MSFFKVFYEVKVNVCWNIYVEEGKHVHPLEQVEELPEILEGAKSKGSKDERLDYHNKPEYLEGQFDPSMGGDCPT